MAYKWIIGVAVLMGIMCLMARARGEYLAVHVGYIVPNDRLAQPAAADNLWQSMRLVQAWYAEQMDRWGFGPKTFRLDPFGASHVIDASVSATSMRGDLWGGNIAAAAQAGFPIWSPGEVWFLSSNSHEMQPDGALLGGTALGAIRLAGNSAQTHITTPYFAADVEAEFQVRVYDVQGNLQSQSVRITPRAAGNLAPQPFVSVGQTTVAMNEQITLDASRTVDPDGSSGPLTIEWDLNGDGIFDTPPASILQRTATFASPGGVHVTARITDGGGATSLSAPIAIRVVSAPGDYNADSDVNGLDYDVWTATLGDVAVPLFGADGNGNASVDGADLLSWQRQFGESPGAAAAAPVPEPAGILLSSGVAAAALALRGVLPRIAVPSSGNQR